MTGSLDSMLGLNRDLLFDVIKLIAKVISEQSCIKVVYHGHSKPQVQQRLEECRGLIRKLSPHQGFQ